MSAHAHPHKTLGAQDGKAPAELFALYWFEPTAGLFDTVEADLGKLDVLVTNAALTVFEVVDDLAEQAFHKQFIVKVLSYLLAIRKSLKRFNAAGGRIVNISSILGADLFRLCVRSDQGAVDKMTFALARELGPRKVWVNSIFPGHTNTLAPLGHSAVTSA